MALQDQHINSWVLTTLLQHCQWQLSLYAVIGFAAVSLVAWQVPSLVPAFSQARQLNTETFQKKMKRPYYAANHAWNRKWSVPYVLLIFGLVMPFCLTMTAQPWWKALLDSVLILMVYDFFYYMMHGDPRHYLVRLRADQHA